MKRLVIESIHSQLPRRAAISIIHSDAAENPDVFVAILKHWLRIHIIVIDEFEELLQSPDLILSEIARKGYASGDCDDVAMLAAAMLASIGALVQLVAVFRQTDGSFGHVIVRYRFPRQSEWKNFDGTIDFNGTYPPDEISVDIIS